MTDEYLLDDIRELNLAYLLLAQRLLHADRETAAFRLQLSDEVADLIGRTPAKVLARLAGCSQLLCRFAIEDGEQMNALLSAGAGEGLREIHAAIVLGSAAATRTIGSARATARATVAGTRTAQPKLGVECSAAAGRDDDYGR